MENSFNNNLETLFTSLDSFISTKTVVGEPVHIGNVIMLPLVDVMFGVGAGSVKSSEKATKDQDMGGLGAKITPSAVIVIKDDTIQLVNVKNQDALSKLIDMAPGVLSKFNLNPFGDKKTSNTPTEPGTKKETVITETITETVVDEGSKE
jgi:uncharacterized spore protein YtfJ